MSPTGTKLFIDIKTLANDQILEPIYVHDTYDHIKL